MLKNFIYVNLIIAFSIINLLSCNSNPLSPEYIEDGSYYFVENKKIILYKSNSVMLLKFKDNTSLTVAKNLLKDYHLEYYSEIYSGGISIDTLISHNEIIIIKVPKGRYSVKNYITKYPKVNSSSTRFGNLADVKYCLPSYSIDGSQNKSSRVFITEEVVFKVANDNVSIDDILKRYNLKLKQKEYSVNNVYSCELTEYSPKDPLKIANEMYGDINVLWAEPNFIFFGWQD